MNRVVKRQQEREQAKELKVKKLEAQGFIVSRIVYGEKRNISNRKSSYATPEEEKADKQESAEAALKVHRKMLPVLLKRLSKIKDQRQPNKTKHSLTVLMVYGIIMFVYNMSSLRNCNKEMSTAIFFQNMNAMFPEFETMPHADTLSRLLEKIKVSEIEESLLELFEHLVKKKKFRNHLINQRYVIAIDGTQKFMRTEKWAEECLGRHVGKDKEEQYYVYVLEAVVILDNGITLPLMSEFLNNEEYKDVISDKQDSERKAFYRFAERIKKRFPKLKITLTMDGLFACGPVIKTCRDYGWDFMIVFKEGCMPTAFADAMGLIRITPENEVKRILGDRAQVYKWVNDIEYTYVVKGKNKEVLLHVVICEETWEEISRETGKVETKSTRYVWVSEKKLTQSNVEKRCIKIGRYRWKIENNFLVLKHQGYEYEHCFSYNWNAMVGFHYLMSIGRFINVLIVHSELLAKKATELGIKGLITFLFKICTGDVLDKVRLTAITENNRYQWRLVN